MSRTVEGVRRPLALALTTVALAACGTGAPDASRTVTVTASTSGASTPAASASTPAVASATSGTSTASSPATPATTPAASTPASTSAGAAATSAAPAPGSCSALAASLTPQQRAGQLLMVALDTAWPMHQDDAAVAEHHVGGIFYLGGWTGADRVRTTSAHLQSLATREATGGVKMIVAADQEGGTVQQLRGAGFTPMPKALTQGTWPAAQIRSGAQRTGRELRDAGVNVDLAPVADTVDPGVGARNQPIGRWGRHYATDPTKVSGAVTAAVGGLRAGGVGAVVKHFPGLGRVTGNTDFSATGITDPTTTTTDATLAPFTAGAKAGAAVMVSSAIYPRIDPAHNAVFSRAVVTDLLRTRLGHQGLVMTDDLGAAKAVAQVPAGDRAVKAVDAGVDMVLTGRYEHAGVMTRALVDRAAADPAFAARVQQSATRVLAYKATLGLADCH